MAADKTPDPARLRELVLRILDENRTMSIATLRADGWPQTTIVGFAHDELTLYFVVARNSQKLANLRRDPRASIAIGHPVAGSSHVRGLSMAARIEEITRPDEMVRLNDLVHTRYSGVAVFAPRQSNSAVMRARPHLVSLVDDEAGLKQPVLLKAASHTDLSPADSGAPGSG